VYPAYNDNPERTTLKVWLDNQGGGSTILPPNTTFSATKYNLASGAFIIMKRPLSAALALVLIALVTLNPAFAQDNTGIRVVGSGLVNPILELTMQENSIQGTATFETTGTVNGIDFAMPGKCGCRNGYPYN